MRNSISRGEPATRPSLKPAIPHALEKVRMTRRFGSSAASGSAESPPYSA